MQIFAPDHVAVAEQDIRAEIVGAGVGAARVDGDQVEALLQGRFDRGLGKAIAQHAVRQDHEFIVRADMLTGHLDLPSP